MLLALWQWGDEHGKVTLAASSEAKDGAAAVAAAAKALSIGTQLTLAVSHCDPTVNLHDQFFVVEQGKVVEVWPILGRGKCS